MSSTLRRLVVLSALMAIFVLPARAQDEGPGLKAAGTDLLWPRLQGRFLATLAMPSWRAAAWEGRESQGLRLESLSLLGDYFFATPTSPRIVTGFRATSGLIIGTPTNRSLSGLGGFGPGRPAAGAASTLLPAVPTDPAGYGSTQPYLGFGYTSIAQRGGWGFTADIGLIAQSPGSVVRFGRVLSGTQSLDDVLRDMRLSPLLNVGVSYSF
jgi:hypothetical protein